MAKQPPDVRYETASQLSPSKCKQRNAMSVIRTTQPAIRNGWRIEWLEDLDEYIVWKLEIRRLMRRQGITILYKPLSEVPPASILRLSRVKISMRSRLNMHIRLYFYAWLRHHKMSLRSHITQLRDYYTITTEFTLSFMLHLLFTRQDVHDLYLHVTEQENVHFEPKFTGWSILPLADWVCGSEVGWAPKHLLMSLPSCGAPTTPILCPQWQPIALWAPVSPTFNQIDSSRGRTKIYIHKLLKHSEISIKPIPPFSMSTCQISLNLHPFSILKVRPNLWMKLRIQVISHSKLFNNWSSRLS